MADKAKPLTPYQRLKTTLREYADSVEFRKTKVMWVYPKSRLGEGWKLSDLAERVSAAEQLGYDVVLENTETGLRVLYRQKMPARPWEANHD